MLIANTYQSLVIEAGCDEAGRGCYAGPVVAAAAILPTNFYHPLLNDSKQVKEKDRELLRHYIKHAAVTFGVSFITNEEIDQINILKASFKAMHKAIDEMKVLPELLLIDGNRFVPYKTIKHACIVKGDAKYANIAAASILAKTYRDDFMRNIDKEYPQYDWKNNKGYGTLTHRNAIEKYGLTPYHRKSYNILPKQ